MPPTLDCPCRAWMMAPHSIVKFRFPEIWKGMASERGSLFHSTCGTQWCVHCRPSCWYPLTPLPTKRRAQDAGPRCRGSFPDTALLLHSIGFHGCSGCRAIIQPCRTPTAAQFAELPSIGVHLSMCFAVRKGRAYVPRRTAPEVVFFLLPGAAHGCVQELTPSATAFSGLTTPSKIHPLVTGQSIAGSWAQEVGSGGVHLNTIRSDSCKL